MLNWKPGDRIRYGGVAWSEPERAAAIEALDAGMETGWFGPNGPFGQKFSAEFGQYVGSPYCYLTNSGTSALELAVLAMLRTGEWKRGDLIATPALTFNSTIAVLVRNGLRPYAVDVIEGAYVIDPNLLPDCQGYMIPHLLGNAADVRGLPANKLIEDSCDAVGTYLGGRHVGSFGAVGCFSFYASHNITTMGCGGALVTGDEEKYVIAKQHAEWGRTGSAQASERYSSVLNSGTQYDPGFTWVYPGYNMQMIEIQAAVGSAQLARIEEFNQTRKANFTRLYDGLKDLEEYFILPRPSTLDTELTWFVFPFTIRDTAHFTRLDLALYLENRNIETRPVMSGDIRNQPAYAGGEIEGPPAPVAYAVEQRGLELGCWQGLTPAMIDFMLDAIHLFIKEPVRS